MLSRLRDPRVIALVLVGAVAFGSYAIGPAISGGPLSKKKAKKIFYTKAASEERFLDQAEGSAQFLDPAEGDGRYYTKGASDGRYYTKGASDSRFLSARGGTTVSVGPSDWNSNVVVSQQPGFYTASNAGGMDITHVANVTLPTRVAGRTLRLASVQICYELTAATLDRLRIQRSAGAAADPVPVPTPLVLDNTDRVNTSECRTYAPAQPASLGAAPVISIDALVDHTGGPGTITIGRTTIALIR